MAAVPSLRVRARKAWTPAPVVWPFQAAELGWAVDLARVGAEMLESAAAVSALPTISPVAVLLAGVAALAGVAMAGLPRALSELPALFGSAGACSLAGTSGPESSLGAAPVVLAEAAGAAV
jgi:hypothetical protein